MPRQPTVALIGRQNVGKSTLFNILVEEPRAVISSIAGTTRDRNTARLRWRGREWQIVDTGGIEEQPSGSLGESVRRQAERAIRDADVLCCVIDGTAELTREDELIARLARHSRKPAVLAVNKLDGPRDRQRVPPDLRRLGFERPVLVSAKNGTGTGDLLDAIAEVLPSAPEARDDDELGLILIGKTNVGKSSLLNRLLGDERVIVSETPHTTRDPQDAVLVFQGTRFRIIDTAGIRKQAKRRLRLRAGADAAIEESSVNRSLRLLSRADVAVLVLDGSLPVTSQDRHVAEAAVAAGTGLLIAANKWDLAVEPDSWNRVTAERRVYAELPFLTWAPVVPVSAATGRGVRRILTEALAIHEARRSKMSERSCERFLKHMLKKRRPPRLNGKPLRIHSLRQTGSEPPTFVLVIGSRQALPVAYRRAFINELRSYYHLAGTGIRLFTESAHRQ